jgi:hypothetical protein
MRALTRVALALVAVVAAPALLPAQDAAFPLRIGPTGRYLVDQRGVPFLIHGDTPWSLTHNLTFEEAVRYMTVRKAQGFNALMVSTPDAYDPDGKKAYSPDRYGQQPFLGEDLTQPNAPYWAHVDRVFKEAEKRGFLLLVTPAYLGADKDGYVDLLKKAGPPRCREYGLWIGKRYRALTNLLWVHGGDRNPWDVKDEVRALAQAIREVDEQHLHTAHWANGTRPSTTSATRAGSTSTAPTPTGRWPGASSPTPRTSPRGRRSSSSRTTRTTSGARPRTTCARTRTGRSSPAPPAISSGTSRSGSAGAGGSRRSTRPGPGT